MTVNPHSKIVFYQDLKSGETEVVSAEPVVALMPAPSLAWCVPVDALAWIVA